MIHRRVRIELLRIGRLWTLVWGVLITGVALLFQTVAGGGQTPVVVFALSIASITYGGLLGAYLLAAGPARIQGRDVILAVGLTVAVMLTLFLAKASLAWPWYVPLGSFITVATGLLSCALRGSKGEPV